MSFEEAKERFGPRHDGETVYAYGLRLSQLWNAYNHRLHCRRVGKPFCVHPGWTKALPTLPPRYSGWGPNPAYLNFMYEVCGLPHRILDQEYLQSCQVHPIEIALNLPLTPYNGSYDATCNKLEHIMRKRQMIA